MTAKPPVPPFYPNMNGGEIRKAHVLCAAPRLLVNPEGHLEIEAYYRVP
jgi:hypothetical protein